jgi:hypothetical protein
MQVFEEQIRESLRTVAPELNEQVQITSAELAAHWYAKEATEDIKAGVASFFQREHRRRPEEFRTKEGAKKFGALLKGLLRCVPCGCTVTPAHTTKGDRRQDEQKRASVSRCLPWDLAHQRLFERRAFGCGPDGGSGRHVRRGGGLTMSAERRPAAPMPVRPSGRHPCARPLRMGRDRRAWARIDRHCEGRWRCGAMTWRCGATTWRCGAAMGRRGPATGRRPALIVRPLAQAEAKSPLRTVPLSSEGRRGVRRSTGRTSTSLPGRGRASVDARFDMMHLDVVGTRKNAECTIRRGRLGRRRGGEMSGQ